MAMCDGCLNEAQSCLHQKCRDVLQPSGTQAQQAEPEALCHRPTFGLLALLLSLLLFLFSGGMVPSCCARGDKNPRKGGLRMSQ